MDHISPGTGGSNDELSGQVVPFGKYKGRSVAELAADDSYREWVLAQPWVRAQYASFYQILIHGGPPPQNSPEHNEMQARFLDGNWCLSLARLLPDLADHGLRDAVDQITAWRKENLAANPQIAETVSIKQPEVSDVQMENQGWDVTFRYRPSMLVQTWACRCDVQPDPEWQSKAKDSGFTSVRQQWLNDSYKPGEPCPPYPYGRPAKPVKPGRPPQTIAGYLQEPPSWYERELTAYSKALAEYPEKLAEYSEREARAQAEYKKELAEYPGKLAAYQDQRHYALDHYRNQNTFIPRTQWRQPLIAVELKPDLGDDYPNVLRQVQKYMTVRRSYGHGHYGDEPTCSAAFVVARRAQFTSVTWEQVRQIFAKSSIRLVSESSLGNGQPL